MIPETEKALYVEGIRLFNERRFFEAHEVWEEVWREARGLKHEFYQGLIQCAVALEHWRRGNPRGVRSLHRSYLEKFRNLPEEFMGLEVGKFLDAMERALGPALAGTLGDINKADLPIITLKHDPFELR